MPVQIRKVNNKYEVYDPRTNKIYGTHPNRASAIQQMQALYANVPDMKEEKEKK